MTLFQAALLGLVQGLTEFLPVSSSGHLVIFQQLFKFQEPPVAFDIFLHVSTLLAVLIFFKDKLLHLNHHQVKLIGVATIPAVLFSLILKPFINTLFSSLFFLSFGFLFSAVIMFLSDKIKVTSKTIEQLNSKNALIIGIFQAIAIIPSISRSGATIYAGLKANLQRDSAVTFAFLISIPAILGAVVFQLAGVETGPKVALIPTLIGMLVAFFAGLWGLKLLQKLVVNSHLYYFGWYCLIISAVTLIWALKSI